MANFLTYLLICKYSIRKFLILEYNHYPSLIYEYRHYEEFQLFGQFPQHILPMDISHLKRNHLKFLSQNPQYPDLEDEYFYSF